MSMTPEKDAPMPAGVEAMSKQQLWNWFQRTQRAAAETLALREKFFVTTTGLHPSRSHLLGDPSTTIEEQRKRIKGLEQQMGEMQRGYDKKLRKALAAAQASEKQALAALVKARLLFGSMTVAVEAGGDIPPELLAEFRVVLGVDEDGTSEVPAALPTASAGHP